MANNTTFIPESGLTTDNNVHASSNTAPKRTAPGISTPPVIVKEADRMNEELSALGSSIDKNGHPVGKYHSFFYELLTWKHPRASGLILVTLLTSLVFTRFVNVPKFLFRVLWVALLSSTTLEVAGKFVFKGDKGLISQFAPAEYYTVSRQSLDPIFDEAFSLVNFAITEAQRLLFARNVKHTSIAFALSFVAYNLIKFLPLWGLAAIGLVLAFSLPPVYINNQKTIDAHIHKASEISAAHYNNAVDVASKQAEVYSEKARSAAIDLGNKAGVDVHKYIGGPGLVNTPVTSTLNKEPRAELNTPASSTFNKEPRVELNTPASSTFNKEPRVELNTPSTFNREPRVELNTPVTSNLSKEPIREVPLIEKHVVADEMSQAPAIPSTDGVYVK